jgi:hypothetical protein
MMSVVSLQPANPVRSNVMVQARLIVRSKHSAKSLRGPQTWGVAELLDISRPTEQSKLGNPSDSVHRIKRSDGAANGTM